MLAILSPAKIQNFSFLQNKFDYSLPQFLNEASVLIEQLREYSIQELATMLKVNLTIATENNERYFRWHTPFSTDNAKQAMFVYDGEAFRGLDAPSMRDDAIEYAQRHLRIFSSLYGVLRPLDLIQAYRLDQLTKIKPDGYNNLNQFWRDKMTNAIIEALKESDNPNVLLNLASNEYFKVLDRKKIDAQIINVEFLQYKPDIDNYKPITIYTKKARGQMVRFIMDHHIKDIDELKAFDTDGYWYNEELSKANNLVFVRSLL